MGGDPASDGLRAGTILWCRLAHLCEQTGQVGIGLAEQILAAYLGTNRFLQKFRRRQVPPFDLLVEIVRKIHLHPWHTSNYTHNSKRTCKNSR